ncbi:hypothetical protein [Amycolatopsis minnesotensis]|uniref:Uncharacterized protein n=1 Tax=Amycolatopsis minnesotensis TaxID=337894 RepID=A0ABN2QBJ9_9PSEU
MLHAKKTSSFSREYEITRHGKVVTTFSSKRFGSGRFSLDGIEYRLRSHWFTGAHELLTAEDSLVAATGRVSRRWSMRAAGKTFHFKQNSIGSRTQSMVDENGRPVGSITRTGNGASADLSALDPELQVFAIALLLARWRRRKVVAVQGATLGGR